MDKRQIDNEIAELKMDYINLQGDIEKLESTGNDSFVRKAETRLASLEERLAELNKMRAALN
ncbi:SE1832 family protein [Sporosarcina sp. CAU 1771]